MVDVSTFTNAAYSFLNNRKKEVIMLNSIITPPYYFVILTNPPPILSFPAKASLLLSAWFYKPPCILAVCACRTHENYKTHHI